MRVQSFIERLEQFAAQCGAPVVRDALDGFVSGSVERCRIVLRPNLSAEQQFFTLVHELTHLIAHCDADPRIDRTICEYEADAVEMLVGGELGVEVQPGERIEGDATDDLLASSVVRVQWVARTLISAAHGGLPEHLANKPSMVRYADA
jgi:IrrE N-terminal-like domain